MCTYVHDLQNTRTIMSYIPIIVVQLIKSKIIMTLPALK